MANTIMLFASARRHGNTGQLADTIASQLGIELVDLAQLNISGYDYQHRNRSDDFEPLMERVLSKQSIIFASPVYWYSVAPAMKIFMDRVSDYLDIPELLAKGRQLRGKTAFVVCTSIEDKPATAFIDAFKNSFSYLGMAFGGSINANCSDGYRSEMYQCDIDTFIKAFE